MNEGAQKGASLRLHGITIALLFAAVVGGSFEPRTPRSDEIVYLGYAYALAKFGTYGLVTVSRADVPPQPSARIAPLVPALHALSMSLSPRFLTETACLFSGRPTDEPCVHRSLVSGVLQLLLWSACVAWTAVQIARIGRRRALAWLFAGCVLLSGAPFEYINQYNSEGLYLPLFFVFLTAAGRALTEQSMRLWLLAGLALGLCALTRPVFVYLFALLVPLFVIAALLRRERRPLQRSLRFVFAFVLMFLVVVTPWIARNAYLYGTPAMTVGYGSRALAHRIAYNAMTAAEYRAGWIYWLPDFGDSLARRLFPETDYRRLDLGYAHGFYLEGARAVREDIEKRTGARVSDYARDVAQVSTGWMVREYVLGDLLAHLKVTALLFWRGVMLNSYFGIFGLLAVVAVGAGRLGGPLRPLFLVTVAITSLLSLFYAFVSLNIARYSAPMILPMSLALAILAERVLARVPARAARPGR